MGELADKIEQEFREFRIFTAGDGLPSIRMGSNDELATLAERVAADHYRPQIDALRAALLVLAEFADHAAIAEKRDSDVFYALDGYYIRIGDVRRAAALLNQEVSDG